MFTFFYNWRKVHYPFLLFLFRWLKNGSFNIVNWLAYLPFVPQCWVNRFSTNKAMTHNSSVKSRGLQSAKPGIIFIANCPNITQLIQQYLDISNKSEYTSFNVTSPEFDESQRNAVVYIVVVLFFYSFCIGFMMIRYMQKEAQEQQEVKKYRRYINMAQDQYLASISRARLANRLALQALNTVNAIPQTSQCGSKVTFV